MQPSRLIQGIIRVPILAAVLLTAGSVQAGMFRQPVTPPPPPPEETEEEQPDPAEFEGYWECLISQMSHTGDPDQTWSFEFVLGLYDGEEFEAEGSFFAESVGYYEPFHAAGEWWLEMVEDALWLRFQGTAYLPTFSGPFIFMGENTDWWTLEYEFETQDGSATVTNHCLSFE